jgi:arsenate reductase
VHSAGTQPKGINPLTLQVLAALGIDASRGHSKSVDVYAGQTFDYVITVCDSAAEACPVFPGTPKRIHLSITDPASIEGTADERLAAFEETVRVLQEHINGFIANETN